MSTRIRLFSRLSLALVAAAVLSGCAHRHGEMAPPPMHPMGACDARLVELVDAMNAAEGPAKVDAIAAAVNELASRCGHRHGHMHKAHGAPGCGCPACPNATEGCKCPACPHASQGADCPACPHGSGPCPMKTSE